MNLKGAKRSYDNLLKSGELLEMFPMLEGEWKKDKEEFIEMYNLNQDIFGS